MLWDIQWSSKREFLEDFELSTGRTTYALENEPELPTHLAYYMNAFNTLSSRRLVGEIESSIQISEMESYLNIFPWYDDELFVKLIIILDDAYLKFRNKDDSKKVDFRSNNRPFRSQIRR